ncbi:U-Asilidin(1)-Dg12 [Condylostylus longicornis]|uniref:U-Asilidin(1)-Dg12 n=1 Tax=Condylostylus longicornis TaxID=2530218 RepID=UPI00244DF30A|nr:U-Asilidin(1)-Dg12 [Condylostylus longicornis]
MRAAIFFTLVLVAVSVNSGTCENDQEQDNIVIPRDLFRNLLLAKINNSGSCRKLGEPCYVSDECCSKRCLFYAHKCVT